MTSALVPPRHRLVRCAHFACVWAVPVTSATRTSKGCSTSLRSPRATLVGTQTDILAVLVTSVTRTSTNHTMKGAR